jgi:hypothetical protein
MQEMVKVTQGTVIFSRTSQNSIISPTPYAETHPYGMAVKRFTAPMREANELSYEHDG